MPLFMMVKGLSMLRSGNFEKAIEWTEKSLNSSFVHAKAQGYAILAMAHWHLGHKDEARAMLLATFMAPAQRFVMLLNAPARNFVGVLAAKERQASG